MSKSKTLEAHPVSALFPMLPDDELKDLAADIAQRGLVQPIVLDGQGRILDGRNRAKACEIAGVEPVYVTYEGDDPDGYALMVNIARRHMTKGQRAMIVSQALLLNSNAQQDTAAQNGISQQYVSRAQLVNDFAPDCIDRVISGILVLNDAYAIARENKKAKQEESRDLAALREEAPDLADDVTEERLKFHEALEELERKREERKLTDKLAESDSFIIEHNGTPYSPDVEAGRLSVREALTLADQWRVEHEQSVQRHADYIRSANDGWGMMFKVLTEPDDIFVKEVLAALAPIDLQKIEKCRAQIERMRGE